MTNIVLPSLESATVMGKRVFVRCDFDVPLVQALASSNLPAGKAGQPLVIGDDTRLLPSISTIEYLIENESVVVAAGHLGRPNAVYSIQNTEYSLLPVAEWFAKQFSSEVKETKLGEFKGWEIKQNLIILENLRFYTGEIGKDPVFAEKLASLADIYVNEAFGVSHRKHASIALVPKYLPHYAGFHLQKEVKILSGILGNPKKPLTIIIGGAKIETKLPLISKMQNIADYILVGGAIAGQYQPSASSGSAEIIVAGLNPDKSDITIESLKRFEESISKSGTIVWNGPLGFIEKGFIDSSLRLAQSIINSSAYKVVGGGDTISFLSQHKMLDKFDFVSIGGGAMLKFLSGEELPGLIVLQN